MQQENSVSVPIWHGPLDVNNLPRRNQAIDPDGYIYAIEFSMGVVKVGCTNNPWARVWQHGQAVAHFGGTITRAWFSAAHRDWRGNERTLLETAAETGDRVNGSEYFRGGDFGAVLDAAAGLDFTETPTVQRTTVHSEAIAERYAAVKERRDAGWPMRKIADDLGVSTATVKRAIDCMGLPNRIRHHIVP
jgi:hypothetical protein